MMGEGRVRPGEEAGGEPQLMGEGAPSGPLFQIK